jgi:adenine deaminase
MITINPAKQLAIDSHVGSIEKGKEADLVIYDKHPLSNYAKVQKVFVDGTLYFDRDKDLSERPEKETVKKTLSDKQKKEQQQRRPATQRRPS